MAKIFFCYRHSDSEHQAGRLFALFSAYFGKGKVFKDVNSIPPGKDFRAAVQETLVDTTVFLVLIGDSWLSARHPDGSLRLHDPDDDVRIEIEVALARLAKGNIRVIPILVGHAGMPRARELPASLRPFSFRKAIPIRPDPDFDTDVGRLIRAIDQPGWRRLATMAAVVGLLAIWIGMAWLVVNQLTGRPPTLPQGSIAGQVEQLLDANQIDAAAALCERAIAEQRDLATAYAGRGRVHYVRALRIDSKAEYERAIRDFDAAITLNPSDALSYARRGRCHAQLGDKDHTAQALADVQSAIAHDAGNDSRLYVNLAYVAEIQKNDLLAIEYLGKALEIDRKKLAAAPEERKAFLREGYCTTAAERARLFIKRSRAADALRAAEESLTIHPNANGYLYRGLLRLDAHQPDKALADLEEAFRLDPRSYCALFGMSIVYRNRFLNEGKEADLQSAIRDVVEAIFLAHVEGDTSWAEFNTPDWNLPDLNDARARRYLAETANGLLARAKADLEGPKPGPAFHLAGAADRLLGLILQRRSWDFPVRRARWKAATVRGESLELAEEYERARAEYQVASEDGSAEASLALAKMADANRGGDWEFDRAEQLRSLARDQEVVKIPYTCIKRDGEGTIKLLVYVTTPKEGDEVARDEVRRLLEDHDAVLPNVVLDFLDATLKEARQQRLPFPAYYRQKTGLNR